MTKESFEEIAQEAFDSLPELFKREVDNVQIVVEDYPDEEQSQLSGGNKYQLLGLYQGIPKPHRNTWYGSAPTVPDKISLFQQNIEAQCRTEEELHARIREVLFHELGHYFGMNEKEIRRAMRNFL
ncbi:MAG: metallopeptidase family protein [Ignavibacteriales bacterium]|nr:metallopeptidase family protein [Ignavibacteriales bacterium]